MNKIIKNNICIKKYIIYILTFHTIQVFGQNEVYYLNKEYDAGYVIDTLNLRFEYHRVGTCNTHSNCEGTMFKKNNNIYSLNSDYDVHNLPLEIKEIDCKGQLSQEKKFYFDFGKDSRVLEKIKSSNIKIDSSIMKSYLDSFDKAAVAAEYEHDLARYPTIWMHINDTIRIPLYGDSISYNEYINKLYLYSNVFNIRSRKYTLNGNCTKFKVFFEIQSQFEDYYTMKNFTLYFNHNNTITISEPNSKKRYNYERVSKIEAEKYLH